MIPLFSSEPLGATLCNLTPEFFTFKLWSESYKKLCICSLVFIICSIWTVDLIRVCAACVCRSALQRGSKPVTEQQWYWWRASYAATLSVLWWVNKAFSRPCVIELHCVGTCCLHMHASDASLRLVMFLLRCSSNLLLMAASQEAWRGHTLRSPTWCCCQISLWVFSGCLLPHSASRVLQHWMYELYM